MKITVTFDQRDDIDGTTRSYIDGGILTVAESETAEFTGNILTYRTEKNAAEVIGAWEGDGFNIDEFAGFAFSA